MWYKFNDTNEEVGAFLLLCLLDVCFGYVLITCIVVHQVVVVAASERFVDATVSVYAQGSPLNSCPGAFVTAGMTTTWTNTL